VISLLASLERKLPHIKPRQAHREQLLQLHVDPWLKREDQRWRCPGCEARYSWYQDTCAQCGHALSALDRFAEPKTTPH
jgi:hypothetical protein